MTESAAYPAPRQQQLGEEILNAISHGVGALLAVVATIFLVFRAKAYGTVLNIASVTIFGVSMFLLYLVSCLYHALPVSKGKTVLQEVNKNTKIRHHKENYERKHRDSCICT